MNIKDLRDDIRELLIGYGVDGAYAIATSVVKISIKKHLPETESKECDNLPDIYPMNAFTYNYNILRPFYHRLSDSLHDIKRALASLKVFNLEEIDTMLGEIHKNISSEVGKALERDTEKSYLKEE